MSGATCRIFQFQKIATYLNKVFLQLTQEERFCIQNRLLSIKQSCLTYVNCRLISLPKIHVITFQNMAENKFLVGYAKMGTSGCKKCKTKIDKGALRIAKVVANPFTSEGGDMKQWHHPACLFETFKRARATTKKIEEPDDMEGFSELKQEDKDELNKLIKDFLGNQKTPTKKTPAKNKTTPAKMTPVKSNSPEPEASTSNSSASTSENPNGKGSEERDNAFREFRRLCADIAEHSSYLDKTALVNKFLKKGSSGDGFKGDTYLWLKLLLPGVVKRVYNLNSKQLVKLFSLIFGTNLEEMVADLDQGDVAETVRQAFDQSVKVIPVKKSTLSLQQVDSFLDQLTTVTKEDDQQKILLKVAKLCTVNDLKMFVRLIKHDLRINAGAKHILDALDPNAYAAFQSSRDLKDVVERVLENHAESNGNPAMKKKLSVRASLMTPVLPMLAEACRSVDYAMKKCPNGFYAEIKYDGERVQLHKQGDDFQYFSRSLKPVLPHKVNHFKEYIPEAFPSGDNLILDAEVLLVDTNTSKPLPFGTLGVHKKAQFHDAQVCLFVFDCLHINGENIMNKPIQERRKILHENMKEIKNRVMFSEMQFMKNPIDLQDLMDKVFSQGLEGLVLKDIKGIYEPGKRHWLKIKKDYLEQGTMADSADLVVLGAYFGSGNKGGIMSIFLLGAYDPATNKWCTVTKCHSGLDDKTLDRLQTELDMVKISKDASKVPSWLNIKKQVVPDFVCKDPKNSPVWEISGAEFSKAEIHTADGISIRFPRITKFRDDKSWKEATDLPRLKVLFAKSKEVSDIKGSPMKKKPSLSTDSKSSDDTTETSNQSWSISSPVKTSVSSPPVSPFKGGNLNDWVKRGNKRSSNSADGEDSEHGASPVKKSKPQCRYGSECYQTNPSHLDKYDHPASASLPKAKLPDIFKGLKIYVPENTPEYRKLKRYIIAYDGDLVPDYQAKEADIIIVKDKPFPGGRKCVKTQWLWDSVKKKTQLDTTKYLVK